MTPSGVENVTIELAVLKNPYFDPENLFLALLEAVCDLTLTSDMAFHFRRVEGGMWGRILKLAMP